MGWVYLVEEWWDGRWWPVARCQDPDQAKSIVEWNKAATGFEYFEYRVRMVWDDWMG